MMNSDLDATQAQTVREVPPAATGAPEPGYTDGLEDMGKRMTSTEAHQRGGIFVSACEGLEAVDDYLREQDPEGEDVPNFRVEGFRMEDGRWRVTALFETVRMVELHPDKPWTPPV